MRLSLWFLLVFILLLLMPLTVSALAPIADFSASPNGEWIYDSSPIVFTDLSTNTPTSWLWEFSYDTGDTWSIMDSGNGESVLQNPEMGSDYFECEDYPCPVSIRLNATNDDGSDIATKIDYITIIEPTPTPTPTETPTVIGMTLDQIMFSCYGGSCSGCQNGTSATIDVNYTFTGEPGTEASVINIGTIQDALLDFIIPRGDKGEQGDQGIPGPAGSMNQTPNMTAGPAGYTPIFGVDYFNGTQGEQGIQGIQGIANMTAGPKGDKGEQGDPASNYNASYLTSTYNATYDAKTNYNASYDALIGKDGYTIFFQRGTFNPGKNAWNGMGNQFINNYNRVYVAKSGTITAAEVTTFASTVVGSSENWNMSIWINNNGAVTGTNFIGNVATAAAERNWINTSMNLPVVQGDYIWVVSGGGNWATAPTGVTMSGYLYVAT